jgi:hypothetical protein
MRAIDVLAGHVDTAGNDLRREFEQVTAKTYEETVRLVTGAKRGEHAKPVEGKEADTRLADVQEKAQRAIEEALGQGNAQSGSK